MSQKIKGVKFTPHWLELGKLRVHPTIQQPFRAKHAEWLRSHFDPNALGPLLVVPDPERAGWYLIWDGQHRYTAASSLFPLHHTILCYVYQDLTIEQLAQIQVDFVDGHKAWPALSKFHMKLEAKDPRAIDIVRILKSHSLGVAGADGGGTIRAVNALESVYQRAGANGLERVMQMFHSAWGDDQYAYHSVLITGAGLVMATYNGELDAEAMADRLRKDGTAVDLLGRARSKGKSDRLSTAVAVAKLLVNAYNVKRTSKRLPPFRG